MSLQPFRSFIIFSCIIACIMHALFQQVVIKSKMADHARMNSVASLSSSVSSVSMADLPNLPGVRRDVSAINPKLYKQFKATISRDTIREDEPQVSALADDDQSLMSYFENSSRLQEMSKTLSPFPIQGSAYNDVNGRYSLVSQRQDRINKSRSLPYSSTSSIPKFVRNDSRICSFLACFTEESRDPLLEDRCRRVEIKVYLEDNSIEIIEPRQENSGTWQGKFLKRHQILKPVSRPGSDTPPNATRSVYTIADFRSGAKLEIYNRMYTILDADPATKAFLEESSTPFGVALAMPDNVFDPKTRTGTTKRTTRTAGGKKSGGKLGFFEYDRKVLRFYGVWDSRSMLFGDELFVKMHYSLADNTIEIVPIHSRNSGRDRLPKFLKKSQIMKKQTRTATSTRLGSPTLGFSSTESSLDGSSFDGNGLLAPMSPSHASLSSLNHSTAEADPLVPSQPYHWTDLRIGDEIPVASLNILLTDADAFTREFYRSKNMPLADPIQLPQPVYPTLQTTIPPYNGFGSKEDSLQTCKSTLMPSAPMKDGVKAKLFQGMILRYTATLHNPREADKAREFVIQLHLEDDTVQIREPPIRNSGHKGGIFLQRCKLEAHDGAPSLEPKDVYLGATVTVLSHRFDVHDCDQFTAKYMEANAHIWPFSDLDLVAAKLRAKKEVIQRIVLTYPALQSRSLRVEELVEILARAGLQLVKQEAHTVFRAIDPQRAGTVKMTKLLKYTMDL